jgi:hypothetical protein
MKKPIKNEPERSPSDLSQDLNAWLFVFVVFFGMLVLYLLTSKEVWSEILE